jgi:hypothetical protein
MNNLIFRRINGRIVPIRLNKSEKKDLKEGVTYTAAGVGVAAGGGALYRQVTKKSMSFASAGAEEYLKTRFNTGKGQMSFDDLIQAKKYQTKATKLMQTAIRLEKLTPFIRKGAFGIGTALVGYGGLKIGKAIGKKDKKTESAAIGATSSAIVGQAFLSGYSPKTEIKNLFQSAKQYDLFNKTKNVFIKKFL